MTTAFVTGATGLLGGNLVRLLLDSGYQVRALVRSPDKARELPAHPRLEIVPGTLPAVDGFAERLAGSDVLFHTAAHFRDSYKGGSHWTELQRVNVDGTRALVAAAWRAGVRRLVHTSSVAVVRSPDPTRPADETMPRDPDTEPDDYYRSKILADRVVDDALRRHTDLHATFVLPGFMNGPGDTGPTTAGQFILDFAHRRLPGVVDTHFSYVDARDVALAMEHAATLGGRGERYLVAGRTLHLRQALVLLEELTGIAAPRRTVPAPLLAAVAAGNELWARLSGRPVLLSWQGYRTLRREGAAMRFDSTKAERDLGVTFRPLRDTLADAVAWFRDRHLLPARA